MEKWSIEGGCGRCHLEGSARSLICLWSGRVAAIAAGLRVVVGVVYAG